MKLVRARWSPAAALILGAAVVGAGVTLSDNGRSNSRSSGENWESYHADAGGDHYSPLKQITPANIASLKPAWRIETGEGGLQTTPLAIDGILYAMTPNQDVFAIDGSTGTRLWKRAFPGATRQPVRGLSYWSSGAERRIIVGVGNHLHALDPRTGTSISSFGQGGRVDMRAGLGRPTASVPLALTSPASIWRDLAIVGFRTAEAAPAAPGAIRAYDVRTGRLRWVFHAIPRPGQLGSATWPAKAWRSAGGANNWSGLVVDDARGIVFAPMGSAVDDFYGGDRRGDNLFANSLVALNARTGRRLWHFQLVHHDILDRDPPSPPVLLSVRRGSRTIDAVAQATKHGFLFIFDRRTGTPLFPIEEIPVPKSTVPGEASSPTQPRPTLPAPFARQRLTADMLTQRSADAHEQAVLAFADFTSEGPFAPLRVGKRTVVFPGFDGGAEWGGQAVARGRGIIYVNSNDVAWTGELAPAAQSGGAALYQAHCAACHGTDLRGAPPEFPSLDGIMTRRLEGEVITTILQGKGRMPGFPNLRPNTSALLEYLRRPAAKDAKAQPAARQRFVFTGYRKFLDAEGYPAVAPPWGTLSAIDMNTGRYLWRVPLGEYPALSRAGVAPTGTENYGGPMLTASGLLFIGATIHDRQLRAFDATTGRVLWKTELPQAGVATPITYIAGGRQFVVIATSAARDAKATPGSGYSAFALSKHLGFE